MKKDYADLDPASAQSFFIRVIRGYKLYGLPFLCMLP